MKSIASSDIIVQILIFGSPVFAAILITLLATRQKTVLYPVLEIVVWTFLVIAVIAGLVTYLRQSSNYRHLIRDMQERGDELRKEVKKRRAIERDLKFREHQMRFIIDGVPAFIAYIGTDRRYQLVNAAYERTFGKPAQSFIGKEIGSMVSQDKKAVIAAQIDDVLSGKEVIVETEIIDSDGQLKTLGGSFVPDRDADGKVVGFFAFGFDLSERKNVEEEHRVLAETAQIFTSSLDYKGNLAKLAKFLSDRHGDICMIHLVEDNGEISCVASAGEGITDQMQKDALHAARKVAESACSLKTETWEQTNTASLSVPLEARNAVIGCLTLSSQKRSYSDHDLGIARELGRRAAFAVDNARLFENSKVTNRLKDEFLATLSHELRTPLNVICGWSDLIVRGDIDPHEIKDVMKVIQRNARAQTQIVNDLLDMSSIITGKIAIDPKPVDTGKIIHTAITSIQLAAAAKHIHLKVDVQPEACMVMGDADRILQVMWNLLSNAVKFTPVDGTVSISSRSEGKFCELVVSDSGQGIKDEFLPYIFERFRQEDNTITRKYGGLGLGLAISRQIIELHGGTIQVSSRGRGLGTTFTVCLPIAEGKLPARDETKPLQAATAIPLRPTLQLAIDKPLKGLKILAVDDDPGSRQLLKTILKRSGAEVASAESAHSALEIFENFHPDIVVSDIGMPDGDGYSLMRSIHKRAPQVPGIALTAYTRDEEKNDAFRAGFQSHIAKPFEPVHLTNELVRIAAQHATAH